MAISDVLGERKTVDLPAGTLEFRERGTGPPVVFAHGAAVNGDLWRKVAPELARDHRCIVPDLPLGGQSMPLRGEPDLSLFGLADILSSFLWALELRDVTLVANDTWRVSQALSAERADMRRASDGLRGFDRPALVAWGADDKFFPREHGRRLAELLPRGRFELVDGSRAFIPEDDPARLVELVRDFLAEREPSEAVR